MEISKNDSDQQCSLCLRNLHDPIIIHCGHTFDRLCIQKFIDTNQIFHSGRQNRCPLCNAPFDPKTDLILDKTLVNLIQYEPKFEFFLIDVILPEHKKTVVGFLKGVFYSRDVFEKDHIIFQSDGTRVQFNSETNFDQDLQIKSISNLNNLLNEAFSYLQQQHGVRKICVITDGLTKHVNLMKIDSDLILKRSIIHVGDKNAARTRQLADQIGFRFEYFNEKTLNAYIQHFLTNF